MLSDLSADDFAEHSVPRRNHSGKAKVVSLVSNPWTVPRPSSGRIAGQTGR